MGKLLSINRYILVGGKIKKKTNDYNKKWLMFKCQSPKLVDVIDLNNPLIYQKLNSKTNHNNTSPKKVSLVGVSVLIVKTK
jgi:hypothetical protein